MSGAPAGDFVNAARWFKHISSFGAAETTAFPKSDFDVIVGNGEKEGRRRGRKRFNIEHLINDLISAESRLE